MPFLTEPWDRVDPACLMGMVHMSSLTWGFHEFKKKSLSVELRHLRCSLVV